MGAVFRASGSTVFKIADITQQAFLYLTVELIINIKTLDPKAKATESFNKMVYAAMPNTIWVRGCSNCYIDDNGLPSAWPFTGACFRKKLRKPDLKKYITTA